MSQYWKNGRWSGYILPIIFKIKTFSFALLKQLFHLGDQSSNQKAARLLLRMGEYWAAFAYTDEQVTLVYEMGYFSVEDWTETELNWLSDRLFLPADKVQIGLDHGCGMLVPSTVPGSVMNTVYEIPEGHMVVQEPVNGWQLNTVFSIHPLLQKWINDKFPNAGTIHQLSAMMKFVPASTEQGTIYLDIRQKDLHLLATAGGKLLLSQAYDYVGHEDVLFYLLRTCQQYGLSQEAITLKVSGLIDKESALYKELYQYFLHLELREPGWQLPSSDIPAHYFTSLNDLFLCVS